MEQREISSPLGPLTLYAAEGRLRAVDFGGAGGRDDSPVLLEAQKQLEEYFAGKRQSFTVPLDPVGTDFQRKVWSALTEVPFGAATTYRAVALRVERPKGFQAVGQANAKNPLPIFIPCHRCLAADGTLGGYSGGLDNKRFLLNLEGIPFRDR